jgi:Glycogen recognition site of AMP-activated protein kinase
MNERVHRYLDGELRQEVLTSEELQEIAACEAFVRETRETYRSIKVPDLTALVMSQLPTAPAIQSGTLKQFIQNALGWIWTPRPVRLRPVYGILAVAAVCLIFVLPKFNGNRDVDPANDKVFVQFRLDASQASEVRLAGSFTGWKPAYRLQHVSPGTWWIVVPLEPGVHDYAFVVDGGKWIPDPTAPAVDDGFGGVNSRLSVLLPGDSRL